MSIVGPRLVSTLYDVTLTNPLSWEVRNVVGEGKIRTLNGTELSDVYYRKYEYRLKWDTMTVDEYNQLMQVIEHQIDRGAVITFTWSKFPQASSGVEVFARVANRAFKAGKGVTAYYSEVELVLTDSANRQQ